MRKETLVRSRALALPITGRVSLGHPSGDAGQTEVVLWSRAAPEWRRASPGSKTGSLGGQGEPAGEPG